MSCGAEIGAVFVGVISVGVGGAGAVLATVSSGVVGVVAALAVADATAIWNNRFDVWSDVGSGAGWPLCFDFDALHNISLLRISPATIDRKLYSCTIDFSNELPSKSGTKIEEKPIKWQYAKRL